MDPHRRVLQFLSQVLAEQVHATEVELLRIGGNSVSTEPGDMVESAARVLALVTRVRRIPTYNLCAGEVESGRGKMSVCKL